MAVRAGEILRIESYKHDGSFHRSWDRSVVLEGGEPLLLANRDVHVTDGSGEKWISKSLAICQFHRTRWYNTIVIFNGYGRNPRYYCNIASPCRLEGKCLVYVDYDLDLAVDEMGCAQWLDRKEFAANRRKMDYPDEVVNQVEKAEAELNKCFSEGRGPFTSSFIQAGVHRYLPFEKELMG
ncbi:hypothetical protein SAMN05444487_106120 [Marininema mesophilum]|uniref:DUF402 domain-containing protein n=1 Tax=Marininema mesophilum TaxID=1048340 RepID=A0A1H2WG58_9BACL|nr:DUF402 domain-containing protein [Marininema mesophilum]SDW79508.1 hypothetical protein SAMN05444487_106120 [Marininema mesophilum]